jgi:hypothetical protein
MTGILHDVLAERARQEEYMTFRNSWVPLFYNWLIAALLVLLAFSFIKWGIDIRIERRADALTAQALAAQEAEHQAAVMAEQQQKQAAAESEEALLDRDAADCARAIYGIRRFIEKYHYSDADLKTYLRSAFNRSDATGKSLHDVLFDGQYLGSYDTNTVLTEHKELAKKAIREWETETSKPCDVSYQFAELTEKGIYLVTEPGADGYAIRWRYSA